MSQFISAPGFVRFDASLITAVMKWAPRESLSGLGTAIGNALHNVVVV